MTGVFLHGLDSSSHGTKGSFFRAHFPRLLLPDFSGPLEERMAQLDRALGKAGDLLLIGSSFGGLMATILAMREPARVARLILLAPALNFPEFAPYRRGRISQPAIIYVGSQDPVTPCREVEPIAREVFSVLTFNEVDDDHFLARTFPQLDWPTLLTGVKCERLQEAACSAP